MATVAADTCLPTAQIALPANVRELDPSHVDALAGSIALRGMIVPLVVRRAGAAFELVAGFHRFAAARQLGMTDVPVVVREQEGTSADSAAETSFASNFRPSRRPGRSRRCSTAATRWTAPRPLWAGAASSWAPAPRS